MNMVIYQALFYILQFPLLFFYQQFIQFFQHFRITSRFPVRQIGMNFPYGEAQADTFIQVMPQIKLVFLGMKKDDLIVGFLIGFTEPYYQMPAVGYRQAKIAQAAITQGLQITLKINVEFQEADLSGQFNLNVEISIGNFKLFKCIKERFSNVECKIMNTLFQPFEMNNILIFNFQNLAE